MGWYGRDNSGDDALLTATAGLLARAVPNAELIVRVPPEGRLPPLPVRLTRKDLSGRFRGHNFLGTAACVLGSDALIFGGGSVLLDVSRGQLNTLRLQLWLTRLAKARRIPIVYLGVSVGPLTTEAGRSCTRKLLDAADVVSLRDSDSYRQCLAMDLVAEVLPGFDPAVLLPETFGIIRPKRRRGSSGEITVGVSLCNAAGRPDATAPDDQAKVRHIADALRGIAARRPVHVAAIQLCANPAMNDMFLCRSLIDAVDDCCRTELVPYSPDVAGMMRTFARCDCVLAERFHAAVYAYALGVPLAVLPYHKKCRDFAEDVLLPETCLIAEAEIEGKLARTLDILLSDPEAARPGRRVADSRKLALSAMNRAETVLKHRLSAGGASLT